MKQLTLNCDGTGRDKYNKGMNSILLGKAQLSHTGVMGKTVVEGSGIEPDLKPWVEFWNTEKGVKSMWELGNCTTHLIFY